MKRQQIRIKNNYLLIEEEQELFFIGSYGKGIVIRKSEITSRLLVQLANHPTRQELLQQLAAEFSIPPSLVEKLITRLMKTGLLERFTNEIVSSAAYNRYETQLSFFDLLQPVHSVARKLEWQQQLHSSHILIIGMGGIGNYAALSFAAMGIGEISLVDDDVVDNSNLNRQILFGERDCGKQKAETAAAALKKLNSHCTINAISRRIRKQADLEKLFRSVNKPDLVFISADTQQLPAWMDELPDALACPFIKASYQGVTGFIGPLVEPGGKKFSVIVLPEKNKESKLLKKINDRHKHASCSPANAMIANMAVLEVIKYLLALPGLQVKEKRLLFDFSALGIETT